MSSRLRQIAAALLLGAICAGMDPAAAQVSDAEIMARLAPEQRRLYEEWRAARQDYDRLHQRYWTEIEARKAERRRKRGAGEPIATQDYIATHPPKYAGPQLRADIAKIVAELRPPVPDTPLAGLSDYLAQAKEHYKFQPRLTSEREFKRRYAVEALAVGLTKDQVVRVYALETGGRGTFDMQAGIDPEKRTGKPISSALGYAQLLAANSVNELAQYGESFIARLNAMAIAPGTPRERTLELVAKANVVRSMLRVAKSVSFDWAEHMRLATTPKGMGIHALNLDADVGPWLQVIKLNGLKELAAKSGRPSLTGAEIELMNLAGPRTGLDMMEPAARTASTANFFSQAAYYRNTIVREKSAPELLAALDQRMSENMTRAGSVEFAAVFDEVIATGAAQVPRPVQIYRPPPATLPPPPQSLPRPSEGMRPTKIEQPASLDVLRASPIPATRPAWVPSGIAN